MTHTRRLSTGFSARAGALAASLALACSSTTTHLVTREKPTVTRLTLTRPDGRPLSGTFRQEGHAVVGSVGFTDECTLETTRTIAKAETTETKPSKGGTTALLVAGAVLASIGTGLMVVSKDKDDRVICGNGTDAPEAGDACTSESAAFLTGGILIFGSGLGLAGLGALGLVRKPTVVTKELPDERTVHSSPDTACAAVQALSGMEVAMALPNGSRWGGRVMDDGAVRIEVSADVPLPATEVTVFVDTVPDALGSVVTRGMALGTLTLSPAPAAPLSKASGKRASLGGRL